MYYFLFIVCEAMSNGYTCCTCPIVNFHLFPFKYLGMKLFSLILKLCLSGSLTSTSSSLNPMMLRAFLTIFQSLRSLMELTLGQLPCNATAHRETFFQINATYKLSLKHPFDFQLFSLDQWKTGCNHR